MIKKYRIKPALVKATQLKNTKPSIINALEFVFDLGMESSAIAAEATIRRVREDGGFTVRTPEGDLKVCFNDYIIRGNDNVFRPCKPEYFSLICERA